MLTLFYFLHTNRILTCALDNFGNCYCFYVYYQAMRAVSDRQRKEASERQQKERELSRVKITKEDVDLIVSLDGMSG